MFFYNLTERNFFFSGVINVFTKASSENDVVFCAFEQDNDMIISDKKIKCFFIIIVAFVVSKKQYCFSPFFSFYLFSKLVKISEKINKPKTPIQIKVLPKKILKVFPNGGFSIVEIYSRTIYPKRVTVALIAIPIYMVFI